MGELSHEMNNGLRDLNSRQGFTELARVKQECALLKHEFTEFKEDATQKALKVQRQMTKLLASASPIGSLGEGGAYNDSGNQNRLFSDESFYPSADHQSGSYDGIYDDDDSGIEDSDDDIGLGEGRSHRGSEELSRQASGKSVDTPKEDIRQVPLESFNLVKQADLGRDQAQIAEPVYAALEESAAGALPMTQTNSSALNAALPMMQARNASEDAEILSSSSLSSHHI